ncbi:hypothetical protein CK203_068792 [Vitis vinifera]|uniref:Uncharacterized protein n=1 Tax=Vitis vinifera TaxID=29760 RepID=A0A438EY52_VITVI|nr:hypothetical protein CK203_068792 [Vitis vinifera]
MYVVPPPNGSDPNAGAGDGAAVLRKYQAWKGSNSGGFAFNSSCLKSVCLLESLISLEINLANEGINLACRKSFCYTALAVCYSRDLDIFSSREVYIWTRCEISALTIFLIVAPVAVFCVFVARHLMDDFPHHLGISIMVVVIAFTLYVSPTL